MDFETPDQVSENRSYGSKHCQSSQPRKISRGILVDSSAKCRPKTAKEYAVVQTEEHLVPPHAEDDGKRMEYVNDGINGNQSQSVHQDRSLLGSKSLNRKTSASHGHGMSGAVEVQPTFSANCSYLKPGVERNARPQCQPGSGSKDVNAAGVNKLSFTPEQPIIIEEDDVEKEEIRGSETLRVSLLKILGAAAPHKQNPSDCSNLSNGPKGPDSARKSKEEVVPETLPCSDTIESDSDHPNDSLGRQSTLPLGRKRASNNVNCKKKTEPSLSTRKSKRQKKVNLAREGCNVGSLISKQKKGERQGSSFEARKLFFHVQENQVGNQQADSWRQKFLNTRDDDKGFSSVKNSEFIKSKKARVGKGSPRIHIGNTSEHPRSVHDHLKLQENVNSPNDSGHAFSGNTTAKKSDVVSPDSGHAFFRNTTAQKSDVESPTLKLQTPIKSPATCSPHRETKTTGKLQGTVGMFHKAVMVEKSTKGMHGLMSQSSDSEASEEDSHVQGFVEFENVLPVKEASMVHQSKTKLNPARFWVASEPTDQMDELARAVALLSSALERVKSKMQSIATKRSAEILMSASDKIHLQLQNAESRIQADLGKLTGFSKSNKKRVETRFEELQGELNVMHQTFKKEVNRHLQKCQTTVEGLDAHQSELKATMEKQRAYHRKLLLQAEEAIEADLTDAQKRITAVQNSARKKMVALKNMAAHCLKDGIIT